MTRPRPRLAALLLVALGAAPAGAAERPPHLYALLVCDTASNLTAAVRLDQKRMTELFERQMPEDRCSVVVLKGADVTPQRVRKYYDELKPGPNDALVFYFTGHGAIRDGNSYSFELQSDGAPSKFPLGRADVRKMMTAKKTRLAVLLTDCCANKERLPPPPPVAGAPLASRALDSRPAKPSAFMQSLFFDCAGLSDITAATRDVALCDPDRGSYFTIALTAAAAQKTAPATWEALLEQVRQRTATYHREGLRKGLADPLEPGQKLQTPEALSLAKSLGGPVAAKPTAPKPEAPAPRAKAVFGAVAMENTSAAPLEVRLRWADSEKWLSATLPPKKRVLLTRGADKGGRTVPLVVEVAGAERRLEAKRVEAEVAPKDFAQGQYHDLAAKP